MKHYLIAIVIVILVVAAAFIYFNKSKTYSTISNQPAASEINSNLRGQPAMQITSPAISEGQTIPKKYTCDGDGVNPPIAISDVPKQAKSLALVINDPDAPNGNWVHWLVWNIDPSTTSIAENSVPIGATQGMASSGQNNYGGPCPPSGTHHYIFNLFALSEKLTIPSYSAEEDFKIAIASSTLAQAQLTALYGR